MFDRRRREPARPTRDARDAAAERDGSAISDPHARLLAYFWEEPSRPDFAVTVLARTGAIRSDTENQLARDLAALQQAATQSSDPGTTISEHQVGCLLHYVRTHGVRGEISGWREQQDDGQFWKETIEFAKLRRTELSDAPRSNGAARRAGSATYVESQRQVEPSEPATSIDEDENGDGATIFEQLGGAPAVHAAVELFYRKVLDDERLTPYFEGVNMARLKAHQRAMLTAVTGGAQDEYRDMDEANVRLRQAHAHLKITRADFNAVATHLVTTLVELGVDQGIVEELTPTILGLREVIVTVAEVHPFERDKENAVTTTESSPSSVYERIGGADAVSAAVDLFYRKVLDDERVNHHFADTNVARLKAHQRSMITAVAGGPNNYSGRSMSEAHKHLGITNDEFDVVVGHLVNTLKELGVPQDEIDILAPPVLALRDDIVA